MRPERNAHPVYARLSYRYLHDSTQSFSPTVTRHTLDTCDAAHQRDAAVYPLLFRSRAHGTPLPILLKLESVIPVCRYPLSFGYNYHTFGHLSRLCRLTVAINYIRTIPRENIDAASRLDFSHTGTTQEPHRGTDSSHASPMSGEALTDVLIPAHTY
jgi:hypothetical protein